MTALRMVGATCLALFMGIPCVSKPAHAAAIDLTQIDFEYDSSAWTLGWKFSVTTPTSIEALGVYDSNQDGLAGPAQVGLWLASGGAPLVQTTVAAGTDASLDGYFRFAPVNSTTLTPDVEYVVGAHLDGDLATAFFGGNGLVDPRITVIDVRYSSFGSGFGFPDQTDHGTDGAAYLGGNFQLTTVPLPAAVWLFGSGLLGIATLRRLGNRALSLTALTRGDLPKGHMANMKSMLLLAGILAIPNTAASETFLYSIGNSLTVDGMRGLTATTDINGHSLRVGTHVRAGAPLNHIRAYPSDVTPGYGTPYGTWDYALSNFGFDHVLIQPYLGTGFGTHDTLGSDISNIKYWIDLAKSSGLADNTAFYIYEAWPHQSHFVGDYQSYWNQPLSADFNQPMIFAREYFDSAHLTLTEHYEDSADIRVIPIGDVISRMDAEIKAGLFPEISDVGQLYRDDIHLGDVGRFVATATIYAALRKTSPENINIPYSAFASGQGALVLTPDLAARIESVVWDVVSHDTRALTPVPLPAAAWLFGSGLLGLGSMARARLRKG